MARKASNPVTHRLVRSLLTCSAMYISQSSSICVWHPIFCLDARDCLENQCQTMGVFISGLPSLDKT